jgi:hypothetical protein
VQTGDPKHSHTESEKRERVPRVSTSLGHLSMSVPHVSTSLVHLTHVGPTCLTKWVPLMPRVSISLVHLPNPCHMAEHSQISQRHMAGPDWSTSQATATWQPVNGLQQQEKCQMAAHREATSACQCHMAVSYWSTSAMWAPPLH